MRIVLWVCLCGISLLALNQPAMAQAAAIGKVSYVRGVASAVGLDQSTRLLGRGAQLFAGDEISTGPNSLALLEFIDGSRYTLRPQSLFKVDQYEFEPSTGIGAGLLSLVRGGFRAVTGLINKKSGEALKLRTVNATIGIRGTDFDARLCGNNECAATPQRASQSAQAQPGNAQVVARVAFMRGRAMAYSSSSEQQRNLYSGGPVYEGDVLTTLGNSMAVLAFTDESRISLLQNSSFKIDQYLLDQEQAENSVSVINLIKGGLRAVTGRIAKLNRKNTRFTTVMATIGIRGTGFDLLCDGVCQETLDDNAAGLQIDVWDGTIELLQPEHSTLLSAGSSAVVRNRISAPNVSRNSTPLMLDSDAPRPDLIDLPEDLFSHENMADVGLASGLYVSVYDGHVSVQNPAGSNIELGAGEAAFAPGLVSSAAGRVVRLPEIPAFQWNDPIPAPNEFSAATENQINLMQETIDVSPEILQCSGS